MTEAEQAWHGRLLTEILRVGPRQVPWQVALRNTVGVVAPLAAGVLTGHLQAGLGMATGALTVMFSDQPGPYSTRFKRMLLASAAGGLAALAGFGIGTQAALILPLVAVWTFVAALLVALGPAITRVGLTAIIVLLIATSRAGQTAALPATLLILSGGVLQSLLAVMAWPLNRYRPQRHALADAYAALAAAARRRPALHDMPPLSDTINQLQAMLLVQNAPRSRAQESFSILTSEFDLVRLQLIALEDYQQTLPGDEAAVVKQLRRATARVLYAISSVLRHGKSAVVVSRPLLKFDSALETMLLQAVSVPADASFRAAAARSTALAQHLRAALRNADYAGSAGELRADAAARHLPMILRPDQPLAVLGANLRLHSVPFRHALRCAIVVTAGVAIAHSTGLQHAYWLPMTAAIVLKPEFGATITYGLLRVAGTLAGLLLMSLLLYGLLHDIASRIAILALLCFVYRETAPRHYGIGVAALSGMLVLMLALAGEPAMQTISARSIGTVGGSAMALLAYVLWPSWERSRVMPTLVKMLNAAATYLLSLASAEPIRHADTRSAIRAARSNAQASLDRLHQEPRTGEGLLARGESVLVIANRLTRASMMLDALLLDMPQLRDIPQLRELLRAVADRIAVLSDALADGSADTDSAAVSHAARALRITLVNQNDPSDLVLIVDRIHAILASLEALATSQPGSR